MRLGISTAEKRALLEAEGTPWPTYPEDGTKQLWCKKDARKGGGYFLSWGNAQRHRGNMRVEDSRDFRCIPTPRVKEFINNYIANHYARETDGSSFDCKGVREFAHDVGVHERRITAIRNLENANIRFETVDRILTRLDMVHLWHVAPEDGGFADYYEVDVPPSPATATPEQEARLEKGRERKRKRKVAA